MTIQKIISTLPDQAKRAVLSSLVGSLNASVIGTASSAVQMLKAKDIDLRTVEPRELAILMRGPDENDDRLLTVQRTVRIAQNYRDQLLAVTNDDSRGTIQNTLDYMTAPNKRKVETDDPDVKKLLSALKLSDNDIKLAELAQASADIQRAETLAENRGAIEWIIEKVFTSNSHTVINDKSRKVEVSDVDDNLIEYLPSDTQETMHGKFVNILNRERDATIRGVLFKDRRYSFGDLPLIDDAIAESKNLSAHNTDA